MTTSKENLWDSQDKFVYESPDGGETVYKRKIGSSKRVITDESEQRVSELIFELKEDLEWRLIRQAAESNSVLRDMLDQIREYYYLTKSD
jgi:hypothetical protein